MQTLFSEERVSRLAGMWHLAFPYLATLLGFLASFLIIFLFPEAGESSTRSSQLAGEPGWLPEIIAGLLLGWFAYKILPSKVAFWAWLLPGGFLLWSAWSWQRTMSMYDSTWDTYFGRNCGGSECLYELFLTAPFYTAVCYSIGAFSKYLLRSRSV